MSPETSLYQCQMESQRISISRFPHVLKEITFRRVYQDITLRCFSTLGIFAPWGHLEKSPGRGVGGPLELSQLGVGVKGGDSTCIQWAEARAAAEHVTILRIASLQQKVIQPKCQHAEAKKASPKVYVCTGSRVPNRTGLQLPTVASGLIIPFTGFLPFPVPLLPPLLVFPGIASQINCLPSNPGFRVGLWPNPNNKTSLKPCISQQQVSSHRWVFTKPLGWPRDHKE